MENSRVMDCQSVQCKLESAVESGRMPELTAPEREHVLSCPDCRTVAFLVEAGLPPGEGSEEGGPAEIAAAAASVRAPAGLAGAVMGRIAASGAANGAAPALTEVERDDHSGDSGSEDSRLFRTLRILVPLAAAAALIIMILPSKDETVTSRYDSQTWMTKQAHPSATAPSAGFGGDVAVLSERDEEAADEARGDSAAGSAASLSFDSGPKRKESAPEVPLPAALPAGPKNGLEAARGGSSGPGDDAEELKEKGPKKTEGFKARIALPGVQTDEMPAETKPKDGFAKRGTEDLAAEAEGEPEAEIAEGGETPAAREVIEERLLDAVEDRNGGAARDARSRTGTAKAKPSVPGALKDAGIGYDDGEAAGKDLPDKAEEHDGKAFAQDGPGSRLKQEEATVARPEPSRKSDAGPKEAEERKAQSPGGPGAIAGKVAGPAPDTHGGAVGGGTVAPALAEDDDLGINEAGAGAEGGAEEGPAQREGEKGGAVTPPPADRPEGVAQTVLKEDGGPGPLADELEGAARMPGSERDLESTGAFKKEVAPPVGEEAPRGPAVSEQPRLGLAEGPLSDPDQAKRELRPLGQGGGEELERGKAARSPGPAGTEATVAAAAEARTMVAKGGAYRGASGASLSLDRLHTELSRLVKRYYPRATIVRQGDRIRFDYGAGSGELAAEAKELKAAEEQRTVEEVFQEKPAAPARGRIAGEMSLHRGTPERMDKATKARKVGPEKVLDLVATSRKTNTYLHLRLTYTDETPEALIEAIRKLLEDPDRLLSE